MVKFEDLEVGKDYILISTNVYTYPSDFYGVQRITIVRKGLAFIKKSIELQASDNERKVYDEIGYLDEHERSETISTISTYKDKHLNYAFIGLDEDIEKEIEPFITKYTLEKSNRIKERYEQEMKELETNMTNVRKSVLELIEEE